jgi:hypothetical protein
MGCFLGEGFPREAPARPEQLELQAPESQPEGPVPQGLAWQVQEFQPQVQLQA